MEIFRLFGSVFIENEKANKSLKDTDQQAEKVGKTLQSTIKTASKWGQEMGKQLTTVGTNISKKAGVPLAALTALMGGLAKKTADYGDQMAKSAQEVGMNAEAYQELTYVLGQNNLGAEESLRVFGRLNQRIGLARKGNENYRKSLEQMGVSMDALDKGLIGTEEAFEHIIEYLSGMEDSQLQAAYASDIFGTMLSRKMMPLIRSGSEGVAELRDRARELGIVLDEEFAERSEVFGDTMDDLKQTASGLTRAFGKELLAPFINIGRVITDVIAGMSRWVSENPKLVRQIIMFGGAIVGVLGVLFTLGMALTATGKIIGALGTVMGILVSKPMLIIAAIGALYLAWESDWLGIRTAMENAWKVIEPILETLWSWLGKAWNWVINIAGSAWAWLTETSWTDKIQEIKGWIDEAWTWTINTAGTVWDWLTETSWADKIEDIKDWLSSAWSWILNLGGTAWVWIDDNLPWLADALTTVKNLLSQAWTWTINRLGDAWDWFKDSALVQWLDDLKQKITDSDAWNWTVNVGLPTIIEGGEAIINAVVRVGGDVYNSIKKGLDTGDWSDFWNIASDAWSTGVVVAITLSSVVNGIQAVLSAITSGLGLVAATGASLGLPGLIGALSVGIQLMEAQAEGSYEDFAKNVIVAGLIAAFLYPVTGPGGALAGFNLALNLKVGEGAYDGFIVLFEWIGHNLEKLFSGQWGQFISLDDFMASRAKENTTILIEGDYEENLHYAIAETKKHGKELWDEYAEMYARIWDVDENEIRAALGLDLIGEAVAEARTLQDVLDAIYRAEGGAGARVPYGMTTFADKPVKYASPTDQARWEELSQGLDVGSEDYWRAAAQTTVEHYWRWFKTRFPELGKKTFDEVGPELQSMFVTYLGAHFAPPEASDLNPNWVPNVLKFMGFDELSKEFRTGSSNIMDAWIDTIYDKAGDVEAAVQWITEIVARYMIGASPPPLGPLSVIDEGGYAIMDAWIEGAETGLKDGVPTLTKMLNGIKGLFGSIWDKVPEEIKGPIEQAMTWITDLIGQAEEALFKLDDFQNELNALMGGDGSPEDEAQGFMARLAAGLNEKLDQLDEPMSRLVDAVYTAGATLFEFGKAIASGNWANAIMSILMETESFAKAMELIGAVLQPVVTLFDAVLKPIINGILSLWNGIIDALVSISIFGWQPFKGLKDKKIGLVGEGDKTELGQDKSSGGRQISEITGPTRDLLVDLLSPLANFGAIVAPIHDIRNILDTRLPNFNNLSMDFAGAGAMGPAVVIENLNVTAPTTGVDDISRATIDQIERALAGRIQFGIRGRGGR